MRFLMLGLMITPDRFPSSKPWYLKIRPTVSHALTTHSKSQQELMTLKDRRMNCNTDPVSRFLQPYLSGCSILTECFPQIQFLIILLLPK